MDLVELLPGLHRLRLQGAHLLNAYLWLDEDAVTIIDTGASGSASQIEAALARLGLSRADVQTVVLTHFHEDHTGSAAEVAGWAGATVVCGAVDAAVVRGERPGPAPVFTDAERALYAQVSEDLPAAPVPGRSRARRRRGNHRRRHRGPGPARRHRPVRLTSGWGQRAAAAAAGSRPAAA